MALHLFEAPPHVVGIESGDDVQARARGRDERAHRVQRRHESKPDGRGDHTLTAIACKRNVTVVDITSTRMLMAHGFLRRLFEVFERFKTAVDVVTTSEVSVSVTIDDTRRLDVLVENLRHFAEVACEPEMAIVSAVGENLRSDATLFGRAILALDRIPLRLVSQASSRRNRTFVLRDADVPEAMKRLHETFFVSREPAKAVR
jgi:aspartate kinase